MVVILFACVFGLLNAIVGFKLALGDESISTFVTALPLILGAAIVILTPFAAVAA